MAVTPMGQVPGGENWPLSGRSQNRRKEIPTRGEVRRGCLGSAEVSPGSGPCRSPEEGGGGGGLAGRLERGGAGGVRREWAESTS